ncbi:SGNH hydrolase-type esterase domain-containing protein [Paraphysoderma sedebokerense]|nr:SGNH hydrolase-type esterase domain-containing protein [Paraphysoderma sedebokerense]
MVMNRLVPSSTLYPMLKQFLLFGDSITQYSFEVQLRGWGAQLAHSYQRKLDVLCRGYSGYNTTQAIPVLSHILSTLPPLTAATIFFGANDSASTPLQKVELDQYRSNLQTLIQMIKSHSNDCLVLVLTPPPVQEEVWDKECMRKYNEHGDRTLNSAQKYATVALEVSKEMNEKLDKVVGIDIMSSFLKYASSRNVGGQQNGSDVVQEGLKDLLWDGLHLSAQGNDLLFKEIVTVLTKYGLGVDDLPMCFPYWRDAAEGTQPLKPW